MKSLTITMIHSIRGLLIGDRRSRHAVPKIKSVPALAAVLFFAGATLSVVFLGPSQWWSPTSSSRFSSTGGAAACDLTRGQWVRDPAARPYYTNATCAFIEGYQNCMKHGKPSMEFLRWRWQPDGGDGGCGELERFDAARFFALVRGRSILFVGDSLGSSHVRSLVCTLSQVETPSRSRSEGFEYWRFPAHGFTVAFFWTPFQVRWRLTRGPPEAVGPDRQGEVFAGPSNLHVDEPDGRWTAAAKDHDYVVVSASHWFARPAVYYSGGRVVGCHGHGCGGVANVTALKPQYAQRAAFRTVLRALAGMEGFKGTAILRTVAPTHYENGGWFDGGECTATRPADPEDPLEMAEPEGDFYRAQLEEFAAAEEAARRNGVRLRIMDVTKMMLRRPDGHPDRYGHGPGDHEGFDIDCLHWCLPGPIDVWNELLLQILAARYQTRSLDKENHFDSDIFVLPKHDM